MFHDILTFYKMKNGQNNLLNLQKEDIVFFGWLYLCFKFKHLNVTFKKICLYKRVKKN